jgi:nuclear transcription Y subunit beta
MSDKGNKQSNEFDRFLPVANIGRIIKHNLPKEVKLSKEAKETFQECVSEFISFITSEASDKCNLEKRKTINGDDIIFAMSNLGFDHYNTILKAYLEKYRESQKLIPASQQIRDENNSDVEEEDLESIVNDKINN